MCTPPLTTLVDLDGNVHATVVHVDGRPKLLVVLKTLVFLGFKLLAVVIRLGNTLKLDGTQAHTEEYMYMYIILRLYVDFGIG